jgi:hypothetical protein
MECMAHTAQGVSILPGEPLENGVGAFSPEWAETQGYYFATSLLLSPYPVRIERIYRISYTPL